MIDPEYVRAVKEINGGGRWKRCQPFSERFCGTTGGSVYLRPGQAMVLRVLDPLRGDKEAEVRYGVAFRGAPTVSTTIKGRYSSADLETAAGDHASNRGLADEIFEIGEGDTWLAGRIVKRPRELEAALEIERSYDASRFTRRALAARLERNRDKPNLDPEVKEFVQRLPSILAADWSKDRDSDSRIRRCIAALQPVGGKLPPGYGVPERFRAVVCRMLTRGSSLEYRTLEKYRDPQSGFHNPWRATREQLVILRKEIDRSIREGGEDERAAAIGALCDTDWPDQWLTDSELLGLLETAPFTAQSAVLKCLTRRGSRERVLWKRVAIFNPRGSQAIRASLRRLLEQEAGKPRVWGPVAPEFDHGAGKWIIDPSTGARLADLGRLAHALSCLAAFGNREDDALFRRFLDHPGRRSSENDGDYLIRNNATWILRERDTKQKSL